MGNTGRNLASEQITPILFKSEEACGDTGLECKRLQVIH